MTDEAIKHATAKALKAWRKASGMTQSEAAKALGTTQPSLSDWENGYVTPNAATVVNMMAAYHVKDPIAGLSDAIAIAQAKLGGEDPQWQPQPPASGPQKQSKRSSPSRSSRTRGTRSK